MYKIFRQLTYHQVQKASKKIIGLHFFFLPVCGILLDASNNFLDVQAGFALANVKVGSSLYYVSKKKLVGGFGKWSFLLTFSTVFMLT
jgi:hypothetical protein